MPTKVKLFALASAAFFYIDVAVAQSVAQGRTHCVLRDADSNKLVERDFQIDFEKKTVDNYYARFRRDEIIWRETRTRLWSKINLNIKSGRISIVTGADINYDAPQMMAFGNCDISSKTKGR